MARDEIAGKRTKCPDCGTILTIPRPEVDFGDELPPGLEDPEPRPQPRSFERPPDFDDEPYAPPSTFHTIASAPRYEAEPPSTPKPRYQPEETASTSSLREYAYWLLFFALVPLVFSLIGSKDEKSIKDRIESTFENASEQQIERAKAAKTLPELLAAAPEGKIEGAHLAHDSTMHWVYAGIAIVGFLLLLLLFFSVERANPLHLLGIGLFTGTVGIIFLLVVQFCSGFRFGIRGMRGGWITIILLILMFIGWSYSSALDPDSNFFLSAFGFTFGVGLCEELTKAIPLFFYFKRDAAMGWRGACLWGLASGVGFGVSEGIMYSANHYNGVSGADMYVVRFVSCVALHAMWAGAVGIAIARRIDDYENVSEAQEFGLFMLRVLAVPMTLHGFYDTLLKMDMNLWALLVAILSFAWLAFQIEMARGAHPHAGAIRAKRKRQPLY